jgi:hypothetical protein
MGEKVEERNPNAIGAMEKHQKDQDDLADHEQRMAVELDGVLIQGWVEVNRGGIQNVDG